MTLPLHVWFFTTRWFCLYYTLPPPFLPTAFTVCAAHWFFRTWFILRFVTYTATGLLRAPRTLLHARLLPATVLVIRYLVRFAYAAPHRFWFAAVVTTGCYAVWFTLRRAGLRLLVGYIWLRTVPVTLRYTRLHCLRLRTAPRTPRLPLYLFTLHLRWITLRFNRCAGCHLPPRTLQFTPPCLLHTPLHGSYTHACYLLYCRSYLPFCYVRSWLRFPLVTCIPATFTAHYTVTVPTYHTHAAVLLQFFCGSGSSS